MYVGGRVWVGACGVACGSRYKPIEQESDEEDWSDDDYGDDEWGNE